MNITSVPMQQLTDEQLATWRQLLVADPQLAHPQLSPDYALEVAAVREGIEVVVLKEGEESVGFFPFWRDRQYFARPMALGMTNVQGAVVRKGVEWHPEEWLEPCGLKTIELDGMVGSQLPFQKYLVVPQPSLFVQVREDFEEYRREQRQRSSMLDITLYKFRKLQREKKRVRFELNCHDTAVTRTMIQWKIAHVEKQRRAHNFFRPWVIPLLTRLTERTAKPFSGVVFALYIDDQLAAATLGLRLGPNVHLINTAYDERFAMYSPGSVLFVKLIEAAASMGIERIDFGKGTMNYKYALSNGEVFLAGGTLDSRPVIGSLRHRWLVGREWLRKTRLGPTAVRFSKYVRYHVHHWKSRAL